MGNCGAKKSAESDVEAGPPSETTLRKKAELQAVLDADGIKREEGDAWYVVEAAWVQRWLTYVQGGDNVKNPGPIMNDNLLVRDKDAGAWVPKPLLRAARKEHMGHYRRVNPHVWRMWATTYRGSGPAIWVETEPYEDSSNWQLDPAFNGTTKGRSGRGFGVIEGNGGGGGGGHQQRGEGAGGVGGENWEEHGAGGGSDGAWQQQPIHGLAKGEMEDDGIGEETTAKAAAFFDVTLDSPSTSYSRDAAADAPPRTTEASPAAALVGGGGGGGGAPSTAAKREMGGYTGGGKIERESTAAEMWMYGDVDGGRENGAMD